MLCDNKPSWCYDTCTPVVRVISYKRTYKNSSLYVEDIVRKLLTNNSTTTTTTTIKGK